MSNDIATTNLFPGGLSGLTYWRLALIALDELHQIGIPEKTYT